MSDLESGLAASSNQPAVDSPPATPDAALDAVFNAPEPPASSDTPASPEPAKEPVAATLQPQEPATPEGVKGEPPKERWDAILANARTKAREETLAEHKAAISILEDLKRDPVAALTNWLDEFAGDQRYSDQITAKAAAILNARGKAAKANQEPEPDLQTQDGALVYSADQLRKWHEWNGRQMEAKLATQFKPLQDLQQRYEQSQQVQQAAKEAATVAEERGASWKSMPLFTDHKDAILKRQQEIYADAEAAAQRGERKLDPINAPWVALQQAYSEVITSQALPKLQSQQTDKLVADAARKRAASTSDPAASAPAQPRKPRTPDEALDQVFSAYAGT